MAALLGMSFISGENEIFFLLFVAFGCMHAQETYSTNTEIHSSLLL